MAKTERSHTSPDLVNKPVEAIGCWPRSVRRSRAAAASTNKVKDGLKKLAALGIR
jgi:hypothetical protein